MTDSPHPDRAQAASELIDAIGADADYFNGVELVLWDEPAGRDAGAALANGSGAEPQRRDL